MKNFPLEKEELNFWHDNGYLYLKDILNKDEILHLLNACDFIIKKHSIKNNKASTQNTMALHGEDYYNIHNPFEFTNKLDYLIDHPGTFDVITYLMGPYIQAMSCHVFVRKPSNAKNTNIGKFHTDSGPALQRIMPSRDSLPLQLKVQFFLTDMLEENASNFTLVPGSHTRKVSYHNQYCLIPECNKYVENGLMPPEASQLKVKSGDVLIHTLTLWHAVAPNLTSNVRKSISIRYGQMFFKNYYFRVTKKMLNRMTPRRRRLLGDFGEHRGDIAYRPPLDQVDIILGNKAKDYGWSVDYT